MYYIANNYFQTIQKLNQKENFFSRHWKVCRVTQDQWLTLWLQVILLTVRVLTNPKRTAQEGVGFFSISFMFSSLFFYFVSSEISKFFEDT